LRTGLPAGRSVAPFALAVTSALACAHSAGRGGEGVRPPETTEERPSSRPAPTAAETGLASYYARSHQGKPTADGSRYDGSAFTCAHRRYAFGTRLRVTDLENGRSVVVTVNDRGPFAPGRVIDLSWAAARALGMLKRGLARVRVEPFEMGAGPTANAPAAGPQ